MKPVHRLYGLRLESEVALPGLPLAVGADHPDVRFTPHAAPPWAQGATFLESHRSADREGTEPVVVMHEAGPSRSRLTYGEGITFHLDVDTGEIWAEWDGPLTLEDAVAFLVGPVLGVFLRRRGALVLHASAVVLQGRAIALVGAAGQGKSTLAAALATRWAALLSDDLLVLAQFNDRWQVEPGYPLLRLWDESAELLFGRDHELPRLSPTWEKRALAVREPGQFHDAPVSLGGIVVLEGAREGATAAAVLAAQGAPTLLGLIANTYGAQLAGGSARATELAAIARLVAAVKVMRLQRPPAADPRAAAAAIERWAAEGVSPQDGDRHFGAGA